MTVDGKTIRDVDFVIIGGGMAGLSAALRVVDENVARKARGEPAYTFVVLESQGRLGGRAETAAERCDLDLGAAFVGPLQTYTMSLVERLGVGLIDNALPVDLTHVLEYQDGSPQFYMGTSFPVDDFYTQCLRALYGDADPDLYPGIDGVLPRIEAQVLDVRAYLHAPWTMPGAAALDAMSVQDLIDSLVPPGKLPKLPDPNVILKAFFRTPDLPLKLVVDPLARTPDVFNPIEMAKQLFTISVRSALSAETKDISALYFLFYVASGGSFENVMTIGGGADAHRLAKGTQDLVEKLVGAVDAQHVQEHARVKSVTWKHDGSGDFVEVEAEVRPGPGAPGAGEPVTYRARHCTVAMSPPLSAKIHYEVPPGGQPLLERRLALCTDAVTMGRTIKAVVTYESPWWRGKPEHQTEKNFSGYTLSARGPVDWTMDNSWHDIDGKLPDRFSLMAFIVGDNADLLGAMPENERRQAVLDHLSRIFGGDARAHDFTGYREGLWCKSAWSGGCPASVFKPGEFVEHGPALRAPVGPIHWAGSETATDWVGGYMNGAIQSGLRAALEMLYPTSSPE